MGQSHTLRGIRNQIPRDKRVFHPHMAHGDSVTDRYGAKNHRHAARLGYSKLYSLHNFIKIHMSRHNLIVGAYNAHHGLFHFLPGKSKGIEQASVGSLLHTALNMITSHFLTPSYRFLYKTKLLFS